MRIFKNFEKTLALNFKLGLVKLRKTAYNKCFFMKIKSQTKLAFTLNTIHLMLSTFILFEV